MTHTNTVNQIHRVGWKEKKQKQSALPKETKHKVIHQKQQVEESKAPVIDSVFSRVTQTSEEALKKRNERSGLTTAEAEAVRQLADF